MKGERRCDLSSEQFIFNVSTLQATVVPSATDLHIGSLTVSISGQFIILAPAFSLSPPA
jgi:hypothetical protein